jgi:hypothetical protein
VIKCSETRAVLHDTSTATVIATGRPHVPTFFSSL